MRMIGMPAGVIETPDLTFADNCQADLLADVLAQIRLSGAMYLRGEYTAPWAFESPDNCELVDLLAPGSERLLVFHFVRSGRVSVSALGHRVDLKAGDIVVLPNADRHIMAGPDEAPLPVPIARLLPPTPWNEIPVLRFGGNGERADVVCGYFRCDELLFNAVLRQLPPVFSIRPKGTAAALFLAAVDHALADGSRRGGQTGMAHVTELLLSEALRLHASQIPADATGWLSASADPIIGRVLKLLHDEPTRDWTVDDLARAAHSSRSVVGDRFRQLLGQSPMRYLMEWRMQIAANLLRSTELRLAEIAERVGYGSEAAFSRAFHRHVGQPPALWRDTGRTGH